jgi:hypothetical protein
MADRYMRRETEVLAVQWRGDNWDDLVAFREGSNVIDHDGQQVFVREVDGDTKIAPVGSWIVKGSVGEYSVVAPQVFEVTHYRIEEPIVDLPPIPEEDRIGD